MADQHAGENAAGLGADRRLCLLAVDHPPMHLEQTQLQVAITNLTIPPSVLMCHARSTRTGVQLDRKHEQVHVIQQEIPTSALFRSTSESSGEETMTTRSSQPATRFTMFMRHPVMSLICKRNTTADASATTVLTDAVRAAVVFLFLDSTDPRQTAGCAWRTGRDTCNLVEQ